MKQITYLLLIVSIMFYGCSGSFSKGTKKDMTTGLSTNYNGFSIADVYMADSDGNRLQNNEIKLGSSFMVVVTGVENYQQKDNNVFPGCQIILTDKNKKELLNLPDAFADQQGLAPSEASTLKATLNTGAPMVSGETYNVSIRFFDKQKKENEIISKAEIIAK